MIGRIIRPHPGSYNLIGIGDINNDELNEIVISCKDSIIIYYQDPVKCGITDSTSAYFSGKDIDAFKVEDINNDALADIVVTHRNSPSIRIFYQDEIEKWRIVDYPAPMTDNTDLEIADINNDHLKDILFVTAIDNLQLGLHVMKQTEPEEFSSVVGFPLGEIALSGLAVQDINNDHMADVLVTKSTNTPAYILVYFNNGTSDFFSNPVQLESYEIPKPISVYDLNCDGSFEIITAHGGWHTLSIYDKVPDSEYNDYARFMNAYGNFSSCNSTMAIGDVNGDAAPDIALSVGSTSWVLFYNNSKPYVVDSVNLKIKNRIDTLVFSRIGVEQNIVFEDLSYQVTKIDSFMITDTNVTIYGYDYLWHVREGDICSGHYRDSIKVDSAYYWDELLYLDSLLISTTLDTIYFSNIYPTNKHEEFFVFPNPSTGMIHIKVAENMGTAYFDVYLYNSLGEIVYCKKNAFGNIDVGITNKGIFILKIIRRNNAIIQQIINN